MIYDILQLTVANKKSFESELISPVNEKKSSPVSIELSEDLNKFLNKLVHEKAKVTGAIGAIVINCNPFTLGHRYLIEQALLQCDFLYIFVVEEDKSYFSFNDRLSLIQQGVSDLQNVKILPSGKFILSAVTFKEYFTKDQQQDVVVDPTKDLELFGKHIAPTLNITKRFAGQEPTCPITSQYNNAMATVLPQLGIDFIVLERKAIEGKSISASYVRLLLKNNEWDKIEKLVPRSTFDYLRRIKVFRA